MQWNNNYKLHTHNHYNYSVEGMSKKKKKLEEYYRIKVVTKFLSLKDLMHSQMRSLRPHARVHEVLPSGTLIFHLAFFYLFH